MNIHFSQLLLKLEMNFNGSKVTYRFLKKWEFLRIRCEINLYFRIIEKKDNNDDDENL